MGLIERKKLHKMNRKEYSKGLRIVSKFSSQDEKKHLCTTFLMIFSKVIGETKILSRIFFDVKSRRLGTSDICYVSLTADSKECYFEK